MLMRSLLCLVVLLSGCDVSQEKQARAQRKVERQERAEVHAAQPPVIRTHDTTEGQLLVLDVPVATDGIRERQKCFVWRDAQARSASLTCPTRDVYVGD